MATGTLGLTTDWWTASDWVDPRQIAITITGAGAVEYLWEIGTPAGAAAGSPIAAGTYSMTGPEAGYNCYFRATSGSASLYYSKSSQTPPETTKTGYASADTGPTTQAFALSEIMLVGYDDLTAQSGTEPYTYAAYYPTVAAGLAASDAVDAAYLMLRLGRWTRGRTLRITALKYSTDQSSSITSLTTLNAKTRTTAYTDVTLAASDLVTLDITAIIEELQAVSGWSADSPIQIHIRDTGSAATGLDVTTTIDGTRTRSQLVILLTSGDSPEPPDPGTGGP